MAFSTKLTGRKVVPFYGICSSFVRQTCSVIVRSITLRGLRVMVYLSHTNLMNRSKTARRKIFSLTCLHPIPGLIVSSPLGRLSLEGLVCAKCGRYGNPFIVHCPHNGKRVTS